MWAWPVFRTPIEHEILWWGKKRCLALLDFELLRVDCFQFGQILLSAVMPSSLIFVARNRCVSGSSNSLDLILSALVLASSRHMAVSKSRIMLHWLQNRDVAGFTNLHLGPVLGVRGLCSSWASCLRFAAAYPRHPSCLDGCRCLPCLGSAIRKQS